MTIESTRLRPLLSAAVGILLAASSLRGGTDPVVDTAEAAKGLAPLLPLVGEWRVTFEERGRRGEPWTRFETTSKITSIMAGTALQQTLAVRGRTFGVDRPVNLLGIFSWDQFQKRYRVAFHDDASGLLDIYEAVLEKGRLPLSNVRTGTYFVSPKGERGYTRLTLRDMTENAFVLDVEGSKDGTKWDLGMKASFVRTGP